MRDEKHQILAPRGQAPAQLSAPSEPSLRTHPPVLMNERELAIVMNVCVRTVRNMVRDGQIPRIKIRRRVLFRWPQVEAALAKLEGLSV